MRRAAGLLVVAAGLTGCGARERVVALDCQTGQGRPIQRALAGAPGPVRLPSGMRLSDCVSEAIDSGQLQAVGGAFTTAAAHLSAGARRDPKAAARLGYLVGAVERGAGRTAGFQDELLFRMRQFISGGRLPAAQGAAAEQGRRAGRLRG